MRKDDSLDTQVLELMKDLGVSLDENGQVIDPTAKPLSLSDFRHVVSFRFFPQDGRRDGLNARSMDRTQQLKQEFLRTLRLYLETQDTKLREAYLGAMRETKRGFNREWVDILCDFIARMKKELRDYKPCWWEFCCMDFREGTLWRGHIEKSSAESEPESESAIRRDLECNGYVLDLWKSSRPPSNLGKRVNSNIRPGDWHARAVNHKTGESKEKRVRVRNLMEVYRDLRGEGFASEFRAHFIQHDGVMSVPWYLYRVVRLSQKTGKKSTRLAFGRHEKEAVVAWVWPGMDLVGVSRV